MIASTTHRQELLVRTTPASPRDNRIKNACTECKRRKVRCDGSDPCYSCRWYKHPERCVYTEPQVRPRLTRKSVDSLRLRLEETAAVLKRLFPSTPLEDLLPLSREALIDRLNVTSPTQGPAPAQPGSNSTSPHSTYTRRQSGSPEAFEYDESVDNLEGTEAVADDVNSLSIRADRTSSYLGPSSATAGLRVLLNIAPETVVARQKFRVEAIGRSLETQSGAAAHTVVSTLPRETSRLVDAYFARIHPSTPILDEPAFRAAFAAGERKDSAWLALLNMVLALGVIAYTTSESNEDIRFYNAAKSHIGIDSFGSGHIETLQALALMAGWYLHYRNRPNMASAIMGAVFRMAHALGLHKELPGPETKQNKSQRELRRRIWWSLVVLDAGEATTLGRVSKSDLFRSEVNLPGNIDDQTGETTSGPTNYTALLADIEFSRQASRIQERLMASPVLEFTDTLTLDAHLVYWFENLPSYYRSPNPCPDWLHQPRASSKWRYQNLRIILYRPILMESALRRVRFDELSPDQRVCVSKCQSLARSAIDSIAIEWTQNQYSGWPAAWYLFQACIILLLSVYSFKDDVQQVLEWSQQIRKAMQLLREMEPWSLAAKRTYELTSLLYEAASAATGAGAGQEVEMAPPEGTAVVGVQHGHVQQPGQLQPPHAQQQATQGRNFGEWPLWEGLFNFPDLGFPDLDLDFPEMNSGLGGTWDFGTADMPDWNQT